MVYSASCFVMHLIFLTVIFWIFNIFHQLFSCVTNYSIVQLETFNHMLVLPPSTLGLVLCHRGTDSEAPCIVEHQYRCRHKWMWETYWVAKLFPEAMVGSWSMLNSLGDSPLDNLCVDAMCEPPSLMGVDLKRSESVCKWCARKWKSSRFYLPILDSREKWHSRNVNVSLKHRCAYSANHPDGSSQENPYQAPCSVHTQSLWWGNHCGVTWWSSWLGGVCACFWWYCKGGLFFP